MNTETIDSLEIQLRSLYEEREFLNNKFGVSSAEDLVAMIDCLEAQLRDFYDRFGSMDGFDDAETALVLNRIKSLSGSLDPMFSCKKVDFRVEDNRPVLRAEWSHDLSNGD